MRFLVWLGKFVVVIALTVVYRLITDDYITDLYYRGFFAAVFTFAVWNILDELVTTQVTK